MASKSVGLLNIVFGADLRGFDKAMKKAQKRIKKFGSSMKKTGRTLTTNLTMPIVALGVVGVRAFDKQQKAIAQMEAGLKSTGGQVGITSKELQKMASDLQKTTLFGDEEILKDATAQLLTFTNITGEQFKKTQEVALDLATRLDGDLKSASIMLGKALNDPVANLSALSRAGIQFSTDQKETIKSLVETNRLADAQTIILAELEKQYGGSAAAAAAAGLGPIQQLGNALSDMSEDIGAALLPMIQDLANWIKKIADKFDGLDDSTKKTIVKIALLVATIGPALFIFGQMAIAVSALIPIFTALWAIMIANPIGLIITAVAALIGGLYWLMTSTSDTARVIKNGFIFMANSIIASVNEIIKGLNMINPFKQIPLIEQFTYIAKTKLEEVGDAAKDAAKALGDLITTPPPPPPPPPPTTPSGDQFSPIADIIETEFLFNMSPAEESLDNVITNTGFTFKTIEEQAAESTQKMAESFLEFANKVKQVMSGIGDVISATNAKEQAEFDIWKESQTEKVDILDEQMERELERVEESGMSDEEKSAKKIEIEEAYAAKKGAIEDQIDNKERAMKKKQAIRDKAMKIASAIMSTAEAVAANIGIPPLAALIGALGAVQIATIASTPIPMAMGGLVSGPTLGLIGEGSGTSAMNPEVVAPLDKLMGMMGATQVDVHGRIQGDSIVLVSDKAEISRQRFI